MSELLENFLSSRLPIPGLAAYSLQMADRVLSNQCLSKSLYPSSTEQLLMRLTHGSKTLLPCPEKPVRYCWVFECLRVHVAVRLDGSSLVLVVENNSTAQMDRIQELLRDFVELTQQE